MKKYVSVLAVMMALVAAVAFAGCSSSTSSSAASSAAASSSASASSASASAASSSASATASTSASAASSSAASNTSGLEKGEYTATFTTDSSMFHVNEANDSKGTLTVTDDGMTIHVSLAGKKVLNLYSGTAAQAEADEAHWIQPTTDTVTYSDGTTEEVYGFDIPVPAIGEEFDVALIGEKGKWYDHKVSVTDPVKE